MRTISQLAEEVMIKETERLLDERSVQLDNSILELERMGFEKKSTYDPTPADTVGRQFYELKSSSYRQHMK